MSHVKLYIPGPIEVSPATLQAMTQPMIGHRSKDFQTLVAETMPGLQTLFGTRQPVFLSTSSAWGVMEGSIRNLVAKKVLNCCCGAFSDKWHDVSLACGKQAEKIQVPWGQPILPELVDEKLATDGFDTVTLVHNETSTGVMSPLKEIAAVVRKHPGVLLVVDTVSSFSAVPTPFDELGVDVMLLGSQKALALPPGLALFACSEAAFERAATINDRGYYFDFLEFRKNAEQHMTPSTPCIPHIYALRHKVGEILAEGLENRYRRHAELNAMVHGWVAKHGFDFFAPEGYRSATLTCVENSRGIDVAAFTSLLKKNHSIAIDGGYGKIKGRTFRISNMGDETRESMGLVLDALDDTLAKLPVT
ncbi:MAG: alanine--glyoxylate aminotransferase family protein [Verrucomicrobiales bacterium]|nr:alanine--glyoxylate aminotransferase family protein [Verrucomicrobiales bacterium]